MDCPYASCLPASTAYDVNPGPRALINPQQWYKSDKDNQDHNSCKTGNLNVPIYHQVKSSAVRLIVKQKADRRKNTNQTIYSAYQIHKPLFFLRLKGQVVKVTILMFYTVRVNCNRNCVAD